MTQVLAGITTSLDGYITGPDDGPGKGLGEGGERLHYWVFGGPWSYAQEPRGEPIGADKEYLDDLMARTGAVIAGRGTFEAADRWGGTNPWPVPFFIVTHHPDDVPHDAGFEFAHGLDEAMTRAREAAGERDIHVMGGAEIIRQALAAGHVDELTVSIAPVVLGAGKRLFEGFDRSIDLEHVRTVQSPFATHLTYRVRR
ncbi:MAG TPA: dihydrofolate reductase family protein [Candidatus Limnocylindrales bacterium]|nr:dihydrofolate reductase family protein [Candidatus Limnocylindrales bacterium]